MLILTLGGNLQPHRKLPALPLSFACHSPPPEPDGLLIPFTKDEIITLIESDITRELIREFILMGLEGKLALFDDTDPLAKSRVHAAA